jgi:hypothetical protein
MESWEIEISALLDGEIEPARILPLIDALAENAQLRRFYRRARGLDTALMASSLGGETEPAPAALWDRIRESAHPHEEGRRSWRDGLGRWSGTARPPRVIRVPAWTLGAAAAVFAALLAWKADPGMSTRLRIGPGAAVEPGVPIEIAVGDRPESMTDRRFALLTAELLQADPRYQRKMLHVMEEIEQAGFIPEGSSENGRRTEGDPVREAGDEP